jgi:serine/threonine protein kinase
MPSDFEILGKIASGGMAEVFAAYARTSTGAERLVAIKKMAPEYANNPEYVDMFLHEGRIIASLNHPNIVQMYDMGISDGVPFLMMEYLRGYSLQAIQRHALATNYSFTIANLIAIGRAVCGGLHHAHDTQDLSGRDLHIVHRDVSPHNIVLTEAAELKLIDFGVAQAQWAGHQTRVGVLKGKIRYMAPEQVRTRAVDRRTDVYAVGVVLFELATGRSPYNIENDASDYGYIMAIGDGQVVDLHTLRPDLPLAFVEIVRKAMSVDPDGRHRNAALLANELAAIARDVALEATLSDLSIWVDMNMGPTPEPWRQSLQVRMSGQFVRVADLEGPRTVVEQIHSIVKVVALPSRIDEEFDIVQFTSQLSRAVIVDASAVTRVNEQGATLWIEMHAVMAKMAPPPIMYFVNCTIPLLTELSADTSFAGTAQLASFVAAYRCPSCAAVSHHVIDIDRNRSVLEQRQMPHNRCSHCSNMSTAVDARFCSEAVQRWVGKLLPQAIRDAIDRLPPMLIGSSASVASASLPGKEASIPTRSSSPKHWQRWVGSATIIGGALLSYVIWRPTTKAPSAPSHNVNDQALSASATPTKPLMAVGEFSGDDETAWTADSTGSGADQATATAVAQSAFLAAVAVRLSTLGSDHGDCPREFNDVVALSNRIVNDLGDVIRPTNSNLQVSNTVPVTVQAKFTVNRSQIQNATTFYQKTFNGWGIVFANATPTQPAGVVVISSNKETEIPPCAVVTHVSGVKISNLLDLAQNGTARVELTLTTKERTWKVKVPSP